MAITDREVDVGIFWMTTGTATSAFYRDSPDAKEQYNSYRAF